MNEEQIAEEQIAIEEGAEMTAEEGSTFRECILGLARAIAYAPEPLTETVDEQTEEDE